MPKKTTPPVEKTPAKASTIRSRERRIDALYLLQGYRPPEIVDLLTEDGLLDGVKRDSALRMVQERVKSLRENAEPERIIAMQRPAETERYRQQLFKIAREELFVIEDTSEVQREKVSPKGDVMTVNEERFTPDDKQKARKNYVAVAERLAKLNKVDISGEVQPGDDDPAKPGKGSTEKPFEFVMSGKPINELISLNVDNGKVN